jgi:hypothetical protein
MQRQSEVKYWLVKCTILALINISFISFVHGFEYKTKSSIELNLDNHFDYTAKSLLKERNIPKECLRKLFYEGGITRKDLISLTSEDNPNWERTGRVTEWKYIGSIGPHHIIHIEVEGDTWWIHSLDVVKFLEDGIIVTASVDGPKRSEILGNAMIKGNHILYSQMTNGEGLFHCVTEHNSHLKMLFPEICGELYDLRGAVIGCFDHEIQLDHEGKLHSGKITAFTPCHGWPPYSGKIYPPKDFKELFLQLCKKSSEFGDSLNSQDRL